MRFSEAFRETMFRFSLKGNELAKRSGLTETQISDFRNGKNLRMDSVEKILKALSPEAREYMLILVLREDNAGIMPLPKPQNGEEQGPLTNGVDKK